MYNYNDLLWDMFHDPNSAKAKLRVHKALVVIKSVWHEIVAQAGERPVTSSW
jgi:hypothetical protein